MQERQPQPRGPESAAISGLQTGASPGARRWASLLVRLLVTAGVLALIGARTDLAHLGRALAGVKLPVIGWSLGICVLANALAACRWQTVLRAAGVAASWWFAAEATSIGLFMNTVTPSNLGQDIWRVLAVRDRYGRGAAGLVSVGVDRALGLSGAALLPLLALGPATRLVGLSSSPAYAGLPLAALALALGLLRSPVSRRWAARIFDLKVLRGAKPHARYLHHILRRLAADRRRLLLGLGYGLGFHLCVVAANYTLARSLGLALPFALCLLVVPLAVIVQALPVTINGIGLREGAYVALWGAAGIPGADALALALLFFAVWTALSLCGALPLLLQRRRGAARAGSGAPRLGTAISSGHSSAREIVTP